MELGRLGEIFGRTRRTSRSRTPASRSSPGSTPQLAEISKRSGLPLVATGDVHYLNHEDAQAHEALLCIQSGDSLANPNHWRFDTDQFFFKSPAEMAADFADYPEALARTLELAERCTVTMELGGSCSRTSRPRTGATPSTTSSSSARTGSRSATSG